MMEFIEDGGYMMYPLLAIALAVAVLAYRSWRSLPRDATGADAVVETRIDSVLFWGGYGVVLGTLGTLVGIAQAASAIQASGSASLSASVVWGGIRVSMITVIFGCLVFSIALLAWFILRVKYRRAIAA